MGYETSLQLFIDGVWKSGEGRDSHEVVNPVDNSPIAAVPYATKADLDEALAASERAWPEWRAMDVEKRGAILHKAAALLRERADHIAATMTQEQGKILAESRAEVMASAQLFDWYAEDAKRDYGRTLVRPAGQLSRVIRQPVGPTATFTPWNFPLYLLAKKVSAALAAGCTVILKGAPDTPWAALALGKIIKESTDIPAGVVNVITSSDNAVGVELTTNADVDVISFTGSTPVGRQIMAAASGTLKRVFLELGGKSAFVMLDDGDPGMAGLFCAYAATSHSGQGCAITSRLVVPRDRLDEAVDVARTTIEGIPYGDPTDPANMMGPLISARQREKVAGYVDRAIADGAKAVIGGKAPEHLPKGYFYEPTLLGNVDENSAVAQDELFGPVLVVLPHDGDDDAIRVANNSIYGLSGSVVGGDRERALDVARRIRVGTMSVNGGSYYGPDAPFGGYKQAGIGREMGVAGLAEFLELKTFAEPAV